MISVIEKWRPIEGYEGLYEVSDWGDVKSTQYWNGTYERILKPIKTNRNYKTVGLYKDGKMKINLVHRLVAQAFIPNPNNLPCVNHKDENTSNNRVDNLEWCTFEYNHYYGTAMQRLAEKNKKRCSKTVLQYTLDGQFVKEWESIAEAHRNGFSASHICQCCNGKRNYHKNFVWKYTEE